MSVRRIKVKAEQESLLAEAATDEIAQGLVGPLTSLETENWNAECQRV
jgi:hypothetical protein